MIAFHTRNLAEEYLRHLTSDWHFERFWKASVLLVVLVVATAVLAHLCRKDESIWIRIALFIPWGFGVAILASYWGVLALPL